MGKSLSVKSTSGKDACRSGLQEYPWKHVPLQCTSEIDKPDHTRKERESISKTIQLVEKDIALLEKSRVCCPGVLFSRVNKLKEKEENDEVDKEGNDGMQWEEE